MISDKDILSHYRRNEFGEYLLELKVTHSDDFFSVHDPSPYHERDLNPLISDMIHRQIVVFPDEVKVRLVVHLPKRLRKPELEAKMANAFRHHFEYDYMDSSLHLQRRVKKAKRTFSMAALIFIGLVALSTLIDMFLPHNVLWSVLSEGFFVGAWVSLWHPIEMLLYDWLPLYEEERKYARLLAMPIDFLDLDDGKQKAKKSA